MAGLHSGLTAVLGAAFLAAAMAVPAAQAATFVYVGNAESNDINVFSLNPQTGELTPIEKVAIPGVSMPGPTTPMAVSTDRRFLYVGIRSEPYLAASFAIDQKTGKLTHVGNGPLADAMAYIATDRTGRYLLSASYGGHKITVNPISSLGAVEAPRQIVPTPPNAHAILADPANKFVFVTSLGADVVNQYRFDAAAGTISPNIPPSTKVKDKAGPRHFIFHPSGKLVYLLCELDGTVHAFDYDPPAGQLKAKQVVSMLQAGHEGRIWAADLHITPDGKFLYASERVTSTLAGFKVDAATGTLTPIGHFPTEKQPRAFSIDPTSRYLLAVGQLSHSMTSHAIDQESGKLTKLKEYPVGQNPNWVEIVSLP